MLEVLDVLEVIAPVRAISDFVKIGGPHSWVSADDDLWALEVT